jgi:predicted transcriptional regulator
MSRINARLDAAMVHKLSELRRLTGQSTSAILKGALELYYERTAAKGSALEIFKQHGFLASAEGSPHLSTRYKEQLTVSLAKKT